MPSDESSELRHNRHGCSFPAGKDTSITNSPCHEWRQLAAQPANTWVGMWMEVLGDGSSGTGFRETWNNNLPVCNPVLSSKLFFLLICVTSREQFCLITGRTISLHQSSRNIPNHKTVDFSLTKLHLYCIISKLMLLLLRTIHHYKGMSQVR